MKKLYFLIVLLPLLLMGPALLAQEDPLFSQYRNNTFLINPGGIAAEGLHEFRLNYRRQWQRFAFSPQTAIATYNGFVDDKNGLAISVMHDKWGPNVRNGAQFGYAFQMPVGYPGNNGQNYFSLGLSLKFLQHKIDLSNVFFVNPADNAIPGDVYQYWSGDLAFGAYFRNDNLYAGFSSPNLIQAGNYLPFNSTDGVFDRLQRYYFLLLGYKFEYTNMKIEPSILVRKLPSTPYQMEGTVRFYFNEESLIAGISYRTGWMGGLLAGIKYNSVKIIYSADFMPLRTDLNRPFGPSHEITLGIDLGEKAIDWKRNYYVPENRE
ncbi:MAG: PorP/SprF family type IX secretion system membrane protein [Bacteroidota bacterium]